MAKPDDSDEGPWDFLIGNQGADAWEVETPLESHPEIAHRIAVFLGLFSSIELITPHLLADTLSIADRQAEEILGSLKSYHAKVQVIRATLPVSSTERDKTIQNIVAELLWINAERNKYAHAQYTFTDSPNSIRRMAFRTDTLKSTQIREIDTDFVDLHIRRAKRLSVMMWRILSPPRASPRTSPPKTADT